MGPSNESRQAEEDALWELNNLRRLALQQPRLGWDEPEHCLSPFFIVTASEAFSAFATAEALRSIEKLITIGLIHADHEAAARTINKVVHDLIFVKYYPVAERDNEMVQTRLIHALGAAVESPVGRFLTVESICNVLRLSFKLGIESPEAPDTVRQVASSTMMRTTVRVFTRLSAIVQDEHAAASRSSMEASLQSHGVSALGNSFVVDMPSTLLFISLLCCFVYFLFYFIFIFFFFTCHFFADAERHGAGLVSGVAGLPPGHAPVRLVR